MRLVASLAVLLIALLSAPQAWHQHANAQPSQTNRQPSKQQANAQPANTSIDQASAQVNVESEAARHREQQERDTKEAAFKAEQLRQNRIIVWATVAIALFGLLSFVAASVYAFVSSRQLRAIQQQAQHAGAQVEILRTQTDTMREQAKVMAGQLEAMREQAAIMRESLTQTQRQVEHLAAIDRAYIEIVEIRMGTLKVNEMVIVKTVFLNVGRSPAWDFRSKSYLIFLEKPQLFKPEWVKNITPRGKGKVLPAEKTSEQESPSNFIFTREQVQALVNGTAKLYVAGVIQYLDISRNDQISRFIRIYDPATGVFKESEETDNIEKTENTEINN